MVSKDKSSNLKDLSSKQNFLLKICQLMKLPQHAVLYSILKLIKIAIIKYACFLLASCNELSTLLINIFLEWD